MRQDAQSAGQRARAEQRALRAAQELDAFDVIQIRIESRRVADGGEGQLIEIRRGGRLQSSAPPIRRYAARSETRVVVARHVEHSARHLSRNAFEADDALLRQLFLRKGSDTERHILETFAASSGG